MTVSFPWYFFCSLSDLRKWTAQKLNKETARCHRLWVWWNLSTIIIDDNYPKFLYFKNGIIKMFTIFQSLRCVKDEPGCDGHKSGNRSNDTKTDCNNQPKIHLIIKFLWNQNNGKLSNLGFVGFWSAWKIKTPSATLWHPIYKPKTTPWVSSTRPM
jgi:hypothetical protein